MRATLPLSAFLLLVVACGATGGGSSPAGDPARAGGDSASGDSQSGDPNTGDTRPGDVMPGDPGSGACELAQVTGSCGHPRDCVGSSFMLGCGPTPASQCCIDAVACSVDGAPGLCLDVGACSGDYAPTPGACPGPSNVQCCTRAADACDENSSPTPNSLLLEESFVATCPAGMVAVDAFCIDRYEAALVELGKGGAPLGAWSPYRNPGATRVRAVSVADAVPQGYISGIQAGAACTEAGKRLCSDNEWLRACRGAPATTYPYGNVRQDGWCNDARSQHPAIEFFGTSDAWIWSELGNACINQIPDALHITGMHPSCVSDEGAYDMMGNLHEWTADPAGTFRGGFYADTTINGEGCNYATTAHNTAHWDYSTGFRCCSDPI